MKTDIVNFDYEDALNGVVNEKRSQSIISEFEYIYFLVNKDESSMMKNHREYSQDYLNHLKKFGMVIPGLNSNSTDCSPWWGSLQNKELKILLNSKTKVRHIFEEILAQFPQLLNTFEEQEIELFLNASPYEKYIIKSAFGVSGSGNRVLARSEVKQSILNLKGEEYLLEPFYERIFDVGITIESRENIFYVRNFNGLYGRFSGGELITKQKMIDLLKPLGLNLDDLIDFYKERLLLLGVFDSIQIDTFFFKDFDGTMRFMPMCEINYRKTMGLVIKNLDESLGHGRWFIVPKKIKEEHYSDILRDINERFGDDVFITSPPKTRFLSFYIRGGFDSEDELANTLGIKSFI
ncbi:hypothetical protein HBN50_13945 [Halobacteriovorax sp. GB3]|uniref:hypothetical protein n=1 Tax=Halobacteriovorax sp. GB3 TaxID=2719615 RepID=UPI00235EFE46|nr:hypothetical protein [Halobacteriovorax sp. GB3]MDD0854210.1 hypothetical protein [Halobacteriovorax sp. GB3]